MEDGTSAVNIIHDIIKKIDSMTCFISRVLSDSENNDQRDVVNPDLATYDALEVHVQEESADGKDALERIKESAAI